MHLPPLVIEGQSLLLLLANLHWGDCLNAPELKIYLRPHIPRCSLHFNYMETDHEIDRIKWKKTRHDFPSSVLIYFVQREMPVCNSQNVGLALKQGHLSDINSNIWKMFTAWATCIKIDLVLDLKESLIAKPILPCHSWIMTVRWVKWTYSEPQSPLTPLSYLNLTTWNCSCKTIGFEKAEFVTPQHLHTDQPSGVLAQDLRH